MAERAKKAPGIADYRVSLRKRKVTFLDEIDRLIDLKPLARPLNKRLKRQPEPIGNPACPAPHMFKVGTISWPRTEGPDRAEQANGLLFVARADVEDQRDHLQPPWLHQE